MANESDDLAGTDKGFDQLDRVRIFREIPQRPMATRIEHRIEVLLLHLTQSHCIGKLRLSSLVGIEASSKIGLKRRLIALRVKRRLATFRRRQGNLGTRISERIVRGCQFLQPKAGSSASIAKLIVRRQHHENFHRNLLMGLARAIDASQRGRDQ